ncbi:hypothetical protein EYC58_00280 [Candidatus Saccharibacteria bacterium]|nr:MAG: hypothetical protein EYC58_00280 [Candidatus Saccharibacteria bacterium]
MSKHSILYDEKLKNSLKWPFRALRRYWRRGWWQRVVVCAVGTLAVVFGTMYGIAVWYQHTQNGKPTVVGVTFIADYARSLGLDPRETYQATLDDLGVKHLRLVSYWKNVEPTEGQYDFSELDYEIQQAEAHGANVTLAVGLRQPRWPECHAPDWVDTSKPVAEWQPQLERYMTAVINRYKASPAIESYQLENEYFNRFGECYNFDRARLDQELALVRKLDPKHPVIVSRSNNYVGFTLKKPLPDIIGISVYRRVWDGNVSKRYFQYPFPSWYYGFLAGAQQLLTGTPSVLHELQTEPWPPEGKNITDISLEEQNKTFDAERFKTTVEFGKQTGLKQMDLWGVEYWYYRMHTLHDPSVWNAAEEVFSSKSE